MMKTFLGGLSLCALFFLGACQNSDDEQVVPVVDGETTKVKFELDTSSLVHDPSTRTYTPSYDKSGFSIYAFKQEGSNFVFNKEVNLNNMTYDTPSQKWIVSDNLPIGVYQFVHAYGVKNQSNLTKPSWNGMQLGSQDLAIGYTGNGSLNEVFLEVDKDANSLTPYSLGVDENANQTVTATLRRAVSRVDMLFVSAVREGEGYREIPYYDAQSNILGGKTIESIELEFTSVSNRMNFFGEYATTTPSNKNVVLQSGTPGWYNFINTITIGSGTETTVGTSDYRAYDNVESADIMRGGAHIFGSYLFPNENADRTTGLRLTINPTEGESRIITVDNNIPLERNKVTIIKIYVLNNNNIFTTTVDFEVEVITEWEDEAHEGTGTLS